MKRVISVIIFLSFAVAFIFSQAPLTVSAVSIVAIDGLLDETYTQNGFAFELNPINKDGWHNVMSDHLPNTANLTGSGYYTFDNEWVYVYVECKQPEAFAVGQRGLFGNCVVLANAKPSIANYVDGGVEGTEGDYKLPEKGYQRMNITNLETACTSEADGIFSDSIFDSRTKWFSTWFRNEENDREGVAVKRTADNKGYAVEYKWKRDSEEASAMFSVGFRFANASGIKYIMGTGGAEMYNYSGMIRVYFDESVNDPIKIDGVKDAAYSEGNCVELELIEAYPVSFPGPDEDLNAKAYLRWDSKYIYTCIVANYNRPMIMPPDNLHENKNLLDSNKVDSIQFGFDVNPDETCSIVQGNRAEAIWFAMSPNAWATMGPEPYVYIDNLALLYCSPNQTSPKATALNLAASHYDFWQQPNFATSLSEDNKTYTVEVRVRRDLDSKNFNYTFIANMATPEGDGSRLIRSTSGMKAYFRSTFSLMTYADYTAKITDEDSGVSYRDINERLPEGVTFNVTPITSGADYDKAFVRAGDGKVLSVYKLLFKDGATDITELDQEIGIGLPLPAGRDDELDLIIYDIANNMQMDITLVDDQMYFYTNNLSTYAVIDMNPGSTDEPPVDEDEDEDDDTDVSDNASNETESPDTGDNILHVMGMIAVLGGLIVTLTRKSLIIKDK